MVDDGDLSRAVTPSGRPQTSLDDAEEVVSTELSEVCALETRVRLGIRGARVMAIESSTIFGETARHPWKLRYEGV